MASQSEIAIFWHRRDLRLEDNHALYRALSSGYAVLCLFIFDREILDQLPARDARVQFIHQELLRLHTELAAQGGALLVRYGKPEEIWPALIEEYQPRAVFANRDYEPYALERDKAIYALLQKHDIAFKAYKDHVLLDKNEVLKDNGEPYVVFTPYMKKHKEVLPASAIVSYPSEEELGALWQREAFPIPSLAEMGFEAFDFDYPARDLDAKVIRQYHETRDIPGIKGTSRLSVHLRFGTISIRSLARLAQKENQKFYNELVWRDFYQAIIYHFPHSAEGNFRPDYDRIEWDNNEEYFQAWCEGKTGYPLVDAGMRELNASGFMHNRVRMLVASFLTKHLGIDWRWGEAYFAEKLLDYEAASNVGGWQWAAGSGVDAAPYFRIFNPETQFKKFDPDARYVKHWVPEYGTSAYPQPIVEHKAAREAALARYKKALKS